MRAALRPASQVLTSEEALRQRLYASLVSQGFEITSTLRPKHNEKEMLRLVHHNRRIEQLTAHSRFLEKNLDLVRKFAIDGKSIDPEKIDLELREVGPGTDNAKLFLWWNLVWWSLPYEHPIGRYMRFLIWDKHHNAPFGLLGLQSPPLRSAVRDQYLGIENGGVDYWINQSMYANRVGALPPFNQLLGGKLVAMSATSNEVRDAYASKYSYRTVLRDRRLPSRLLFVTTTSAYGKSTLYERLVFKGERVAEFIGFTSGSGTFHLSENMYHDLLLLLQSNGLKTKRGYGTGPSRKLRLVNKAFKILKVPELSFHNVRRGYYFFKTVQNLQNVIHHHSRPVWYDRPFSELAAFWKERWCVPRGKRCDGWMDFSSQEFFDNSASTILGLSLRSLPHRTHSSGIGKPLTYGSSITPP
jgi:hypothetical protein